MQPGADAPLLGTQEGSRLLGRLPVSANGAGGTSSIVTRPQRAVLRSAVLVAKHHYFGSPRTGNAD